MTFTWLAPTANSSVIRLFITNLNVPQGPYPSTAISTTISRAPSGGYQLLTRLINQSPVGVALRMWTWPAVNVTEGWYAMLAQFPSTNTFVQSSPFPVGNGSDTSCLRSASVPSVSSVSSTSTTGTSSSVSGSSSVKSGVASIPSRSTSTTGTSSSVSGSSSVKSGATSDPSRRSNINRGAIAGGAIGGLLIAIAALILVFRRFRDIPTPIPPTPFTLAKQATDVPVSRPPTTGKSVLVLDRPIAPAGVESQDAMLTKLDRMRESLRVREGQEHRAGAVAEDETPRLLLVVCGDTRGYYVRIHRHSS
ncbi:hypothetical protein B0H13DRAFT_2019530 [Mycena leptocephala]|nr:hypothetical protein B0H13DRAFT_2019530 [Mycena leptocephala]